MDIIQATWKQLGFKIKPLKRAVFVRTEPIEKRAGKSGLLWLPPKLQTFYGELPHLQTVKAVILTCSSTCEVRPGERICFQRLHFGSLWKLNPEEHVGWIDQGQITGWLLDDNGEVSRAA